MQSKNFNVIIFDWDGTLMDSTGAIVQAIQGACADLSMPVPSKEKAAYVIGLSITDALKTACPEIPSALVPKLVDAYRERYLHGSPPLFSGVVESLKALKDKGYFLAVATGKGRNGLNKAMEDTQTAQFFDTTRTVSECFSKPHPQMIHSICDELGQPYHKALMFGDTTHDLQMAQNAGCAAIALTTGAHEIKQLNSVAHLGLYDDITIPLAKLPPVTWSLTD